MVAEEDSLTKRINQIRGKGLVGTFQGDSVRVFRLGPNAEAIYFSKDEDGEFDGALEASGDEIRMQFEGDSLRTTKFSTDVQGVRYPESALPDTLVLDGLKWEPTLKPMSERLLSNPLLSTLPWNRFVKLSSSATKAFPRINKESIVPSCLLYTSPSPRDRTRSRMPSSA